MTDGADVPDGITITSEGAKIMAAEKVSTGEFQNSQVSTTLEVSIEGADATDGLPSEVKQKLYGLERTVQNIVKAAAEERKAQGPIEEPEPDRTHEV